MDPSEAEARSKEGNKYYLTGNLPAAQRCYEKAQALHPAEPKYASNLSAVLYEQAQYEDTVHSVATALRCIAQDQKESLPGHNLTPKLIARLSKANLNLLALPPSGTTLSDPIDSDVQSMVEECLQSVQSGDEAKWKEAIRAWAELQDARQRRAQDPQEGRGVAKESRRAFFSLPTAKAKCDPTLELYDVGHDQLRSQLDGIDVERDAFAYSLKDLDDASLASQSFLFGGSGDARHMYITIIELACGSFLLPQAKRTRLKAHFCLIDIHPATQARLLVVIDLLRRAAESLSDEKQLTKIKTTLFYVYLAMILPKYCHTILMESVANVISNLEAGTNHKILGCLYVDPQSIPSIVRVLKYWEVLDKPIRTVIPLLEPHKGDSTTFYPVAPQDQDQDDAYDYPSIEDDIYKTFGILLPPKALLDHHPALRIVLNSYRSLAAQEIQACRNEILSDWTTNPTFFDELSTEHPLLGTRQGFPQIPEFPISTVHTMFDLVSVSLKINFKGARHFYTIVSEFFESVVTSLLMLLKTRSISIEVAVGDVMHFVPQITAGEVSRPARFPTTFRRMWLSNVPDYNNGTFGVVAHLLPALRSDRFSLCAFNCLLNTTAFIPQALFCFNYLLLTPPELPKYLRCKFNTDGNSFNPFTVYGITHLESTDTTPRVSKAELHDWLSHILICTLLPAVPAAVPLYILMTSNLVNIFHMINYLYTAGYPAHWLGDFVQALISDTLVTDRQPYLGELPVPLSERTRRLSQPRKVNLEPWQAELELIILAGRSLFPFHLSLPSGYSTSPGDIVALRATIEPVFHMPFAPHEQAGPFRDAAGLLFYKPGSGVRVEEIIGKLGDFLEGRAGIKSIELQFFHVVDLLHISKKKVVWRMTRRRYEMMKTAGWRMVVYRPDFRVQLTEPVAASAWMVGEEE